jgi:RimJ/RimL family protein N-acetyltransferase
MLSQDIIQLDQHLSWFKKHQESDTKKLLLWIHQDIASGFLQLDLEDPVQTPKITWGFYKSPTAPKGSGKLMLTDAMSLIFKTFNASELIGEVLDFNSPSIKLHRQLGFSEIPQLDKNVTVNGTPHRLLHFTLPATQWAQQQSKT